MTPRLLVMLLICAILAAGIALGGSVLAVKSQDPGRVAGQLIVYGP